jgi:hypothetical protein
VRKGGGHAKGSEFERSIAKQIVKAFRKHGVTRQDCWRSVLSGGHVMSAGDLVMTPKLEGLFLRCVECKHYRQIDWWHFLVAPERRHKAWKETQWISQAKAGAVKRRIEARKQGLQYWEVIAPLLIVKGGNVKTTFAYGPYVGEDSSRWRLLPLTEFLTDVVEML